MGSGSRSRDHHWWPVGLQRYWKDRRGDVSWIDPDGTIAHKRVNNRKIAKNRHGHTMFRGSGWETNFEDDFESADNSVPEVVEALRGLKPFGRTPSEFAAMMRLFFKPDRRLRDLCKFYHLDEALHRKVLLLLISLLVRSPANRSRFEHFPESFGLPASDNVGKGNMRQSYTIAQKLCESGYLSNQYFILIHSPFKKFVFGDGSLDWLTSGLGGMNRISGRALVTLTPDLCIYFCTPMAMRSTPNCASIHAPFWMTDWINDIVQIYSRDQLFFLGKKPAIREVFRQRQFLEHDEKTDELISMFDEIAEEPNFRRFALRSFG